MSGSSSINTPSVVPVARGLTYRAYLSERKAKIALSEQQGEFLDKSLMTLSGGALGLTLTFLHDHGPVTVALPWAIAGMTFLVLALLFVSLRHHS